MGNGGNELIIAEYLKSLNYKVTKDNLLYCLSTLQNNRKNMTITGKIKLHNANFSDEDIRDVDLEKFDIKQSIFFNTKIDRSQLSYILTYAKQGLVNILGIDIKGLDLRGLNLYGIDFTDVNFKGVKLDRENIISLYETLKNNKINLRAADLKGINLSGQYIVDGELGLNSFDYFDLSGMRFDGVDLEGANISGANLNDASFEGANLNDARIISSYARHTNMKEASMVGAILKHSDFTYAIFNHANLRNAVV